MNKEKYLELVKGLKIGKRIGNTIYIHKDYLPEELKEYFNKTDYTIAKLDKKKFVYSLLLYHEFETSDHPVLMRSIKFNDEEYTHKATDYTHQFNPPILHRKETMVGNNHPNRDKWIKLTQWEEQQGWYANTKIIGTLKGWGKVKGL